LSRGRTGETTTMVHERMVHERPVVKRTARAILLDGDSEGHGHDNDWCRADGNGDRADGPAARTAPSMILIKRTKPGCAPYWITPGGGVEPGIDTSVIDALHREVDEELGAKVTDVVPAFVDTVDHRTELGARGVKVQHFFVCRLASMDLTQRHGPEVEEPCGEYDVVRVPFSREGIASVEVVPPSLRDYLDANIEGVRALLAHDLG
jgi:ADP-ribose pyrophosphatase YjhB (NUDIX family)